MPKQMPVKGVKITPVWINNTNLHVYIEKTGVCMVQILFSKNCPQVMKDALDKTINQVLNASYSPSSVETKARLEKNE